MLIIQRLVKTVSGLNGGLLLHANPARLPMNQAKTQKPFCLDPYGWVSGVVLFFVHFCIKSSNVAFGGFFTIKSARFFSARGRGAFPSTRRVSCCSHVNPGTFLKAVKGSLRRFAPFTALRKAPDGSRERHDATGRGERIEGV